MAMHGFHVPLACLAAFALSPNPDGWFQRDDTMEKEQFPNPISPQILTCFAIGGVLLLFTIAWFGSLTNHSELWARIEGDADLQSSLDLPEGSVYTSKIDLGGMSLEWIHPSNELLILTWVSQ